ncbi:MAG: hypothetical protein O3A38_00180 [Proteobacteria bacterium]|nr:hypothetical protein [Pseudomonadota bacterium]
MGELVVETDVDMAADRRGAAREHVAHHTGRLQRGVEAQLGHHGTFVGDLVDQVRTGAMGVPGQTDQRLVEMGMGIDQARQQQTAGTVDAPRIGRGIDRLAARGDLPVAHQDVADLSTPGPRARYHDITHISLSRKSHRP